MGPNAKKGYILEVDLEYPSELHRQHNAYPLAQEKRVVLLALPEADVGKPRLQPTGNQKVDADIARQRKVRGPLP